MGETSVDTLDDANPVGTMVSGTALSETLALDAGVGDDSEAGVDHGSSERENVSVTVTPGHEVDESQGVEEAAAESDSMELTEGVPVAGETSVLLLGGDNSLEETMLVSVLVSGTVRVSGTVTIITLLSGAILDSVEAAGVLLGTNGDSLTSKVLEST